MKSPREVLEKLAVTFSNADFLYVGEDEDIINSALSDLSEIVMGLEKSGYSDEYFSWNAGYNIALEDIAKLFVEQTKKGER